MIIKDKTLMSIHPSDTRNSKTGRVFRVPQGITKIADNLFADYIKEQESLVKKYTDSVTCQVYQTRLDMMGEIEAIVLPDSLLSIGNKAFAGLKNLRFINFPEKLESIGSKAFCGSGTFEKCDGLQKAFLPTDLDIDKADVFWDCSYVKFYRYKQEKDKENVEEEVINPHTILSTDSPFYQI